MRFKILREWARDFFRGYGDDSTRLACHFIGLADGLTDRHMADLRDYFDGLLQERQRKAKR